jgi:protoporphyrinogen oxidase
MARVFFVATRGVASLLASRAVCLYAVRRMSQFTRREILASLLGLPAALAACRAPSAPPLPAGEIVGASDEAGHRVRDKIRVEVAPDNWENAPLVIVGGGIAGLAAAWRLKKAGFHDFTLLELETVAGGTSRSGSNRVSAFPWGAHYLPVPFKENRALLALLDEMGVIEGRDAQGEPVAAEQYLCRDPEERIFYRGRWYEGLYLHAGERPADKAQLARFHEEINRWVTWRDARGRRAFTIPVARCSDDAEATQLDKISFAQWLDERQFTGARLRWQCDYACRDDYGLTAEQTSAWAGLFYFCSRVLRPGVESNSLLTWPEGNGRLAAHLFGQVKETVRTGRTVVEIVPQDKFIELLTLDREGRDARGFRAQRVIFAAPHHQLKYALRDYRDSAPAYLNEFDFSPWLVANLTLRERPAPRQPRDFPLAWDNVLYDSKSLGYVVATHQRGPERGPAVFTYYYPFTDPDAREARRSKLLAPSWAEHADAVLADLERAHPDLRDLTERLDLMRWGHAMIRPRPGFIWGQARREAAKPYRHIHFAHSDLSGIPLFEEAFDQGLRAAEEVLAAFNVKSATLRA